ncbi:MAG: hypothetical protein MN733_17595 [Nitrososphaera sp.]|nr:hypothetical protein [Nitrososphaera sp.]
MNDSTLESVLMIASLVLVAAILKVVAEDLGRRLGRRWFHTDDTDGQDTDHNRTHRYFPTK